MNIKEYKIKIVVFYDKQNQKHKWTARFSRKNTVNLAIGTAKQYSSFKRCVASAKQSLKTLGFRNLVEKIDVEVVK
jgi:hypothetical protein